MKPLATTILTCLLLLGCALQSYAQERLPALRAAAAIETPGPKIPAQAAGLVDEVIDYSDAAALVYEVGGALVQAFAVRITPGLTGRITQVEFPLYDGPLSGNVSAPGISGDGILRLRLVNVDDFDADIAFSPTIDSLDVPFNMLSSDLVNYANVIDLSGQAFNVTAGQDVVFVFHVVEESQDGFLNFLTDDGSADTANTDYYPARSVFYFTGDEEDPPGFYIALDFDGVNNANLLARFTISDEVSNVAPVVSQAIEDMELALGNTVEVDLSTIFSDADGDPLSFSATSEDSGVATVSLSEGTLTVEAVSVGAATIEVTADDEQGGTASKQGTASTTFTVTVATEVAIEPVGEEVPASFALMPNYPNPFNPATTIEFALDQSGPATLRVFNMLGREVAVLVDETLAAGRYRVAFEGRELPSGLYVYRLTAGAATQQRVLTLLK